MGLFNRKRFSCNIAVIKYFISVVYSCGWFRLLNNTVKSFVIIIEGAVCWRGGKYGGIVTLC